MAAQTISFEGKINGQYVKANLLSDNDIQKLKTCLADVTELKGKVTGLEDEIDKVNANQAKVATQDYYSTEDHKADMEANVVYYVYFTAGGEFVAPAPNAEDNSYWPKGKIPAYAWRVMKIDGDKIVKLSRVDNISNPDDFMSKTKDNEFIGSLTRVIGDDDANDGEAAVYMSKFKDADAGTNPSKNVFTGHIALDKNSKKLYAHTGLYKNDGTRQASLGVYKNDGAPAGEVCLKTTADGTKVQFIIPDLSADADGGEAVNVTALNAKVSKKPDWKYQAGKPSSEGEIDDNTIVAYNAGNLLDE